MIKLNEMLAEVNSLSLSSITDTQTLKTLSADEFTKEINRRVDELSTKYALQEGHSALILDNNSTKFFVDFLALLSLGVTAIPLDPGTSQGDLESIKDKIKPNLTLNKNEDFFHDSHINNDLKGIALILFTSGSMDSPKGVLISQRALFLKMKVMQKYIPQEEVGNSLCFVPTYFGHGLICNSLYCIFNSNNFYISPVMTLEYATSLHELLNKFKINFFSSVPSHWELILGFSKKYEGQTLKRVHSASSLLRSEKIKPIIDWINNASLYDVYGATEMLGWFASRQINDNLSSGKFEQFWDVSSSKLSPDKELLVKADYMFEGYWDGRNISSEEYFATGDLFENNVLSGRIKNIIIKNGQNINTDNLNADLIKSGLLSDVASFPIEDKFSGETIGVFVVLKKDKTIDEFKEYCRKNLSSFRIPSFYKAVDRIPVNNRGKGSLNIFKKLYQDLQNG